MCNKYFMSCLVKAGLVSLVAVSLQVKAHDDICTTSSDAPVIYVNASASGAGNGTSWGDAFPDLQSALELASQSPADDRIWIATGNYTPAGTVSSAYVITDGVALLGGFSGDETDQKMRDPDAYPVVLSGAASSYHVMYAEGADDVMLDGVTIAGGAADGDLDNDDRSVANQVRGGGLLAYDSDIRLCNVSFTGNEARKFGGAIYFEGGALHIADSRFTNSIVTRGANVPHNDLEEADTDGGAIAIHDASLLKVTRSIFRSNTAGDDGGAIATRRTDVEISGSRFTGNRGIGFVTRAVLPNFTDDFITSTGGAITIQNEYQADIGGDQSHRTLIADSEFIDNQSAIGGAGFILAAPGSETTIKNCRFIGNGGDAVPLTSGAPNEIGLTYGRGAGVLLMIGMRQGDREKGENGEFVRPLHNVHVSQSFFKGNQAGYGGSLVLMSLDTHVEDDVFMDNIGRQRAGALWSLNFAGLFDQIQGLVPVQGTTTIEKSVFRNNRTLGILETLQPENFPGISTIEEQTFGGGAISNDQWGNMVVKSSRFIGNYSTNSDGGAIHNATSPVAFYSTLNPPAPATYESTIRIEDSVFIGNHIVGSGSGGAIANGGNQVGGTIVDVFGNERRDSAIGSSAVISRCKFERNQASAGNGGAIVNWNASTLTLDRGRFVMNSAAEGGAVSLSGRPENHGLAEIERSLFVRNSAVNGQGGGVFAIDTEGEIENTRFRSNRPNDVFDESGLLEISVNREH